ncbi:MAG: phospholipid/cholesterol/gamma-HCH transport system substrate-binding protein [Actinomycetota bacterium]|jgi:phospholipid/cholesterol/gamma-HCH transport system substrate-binding protein|nr:phospholipid/cholesterol/gamma-HCH transport system substrate-binding protein [Actinomycetota bacterium]
MRARRLAAALAVSALALSGCGFDGIYSLPLPGAAGNGKNTYTVSVQFADALDLVPYSAVKVNDATVGHVKKVAIQGRHALVICQLENRVKLPANSIARVSQTSLLGEKFVEIHGPTAVAPTGRLKNGAVIELASTDTDATVEEVLSALSLLLSGGGLAQLHTIAAELNTALQGREGTARDLLVRLNTFVTALDVQKTQIVAAIERVDRLAGTVKGQEKALTDAVDRMPHALSILAADRKQLTALLVSLDHLGTVATRVVKGSQADLLANLKALKPTLTKLAEVGDVIPQSLEAIITYPTADGVEKGYFGDYGNLALTVDVSSASLLNTFNPASPAPTVTGRTSARPVVTPVTGPRTAPVHWVSGRGISDLLLGALR